MARITQNYTAINQEPDLDGQTFAYFTASSWTKASDIEVAVTGSVLVNDVDYNVSPTADQDGSIVFFTSPVSASLTFTVSKIDELPTYSVTSISSNYTSSADDVYVFADTSLQNISVKLTDVNLQDLTLKNFTDSNKLYAIGTIDGMESASIEQTGSIQLKNYNSQWYIVGYYK